MMLRKSARHGGEEPLFSFVVVADTHVNETDDASSSPFPANRLANKRADHVFRQIAGMQPRPRFVIHLGDIVHPVPSLPSFDEAVSRFKAIASVLDVPLYVVPGNHDVGDKRVDWMPADKVCDEYLAAYRRHFGVDFFSFDDGDMRFVFLNSLLINSGLADEKRQESWLGQCLRESADRRVFVSMHYPPYIYRTDERPNYDNVDEPGRGRLLELLRLPQVEAVFAGHVHNFWYDRIGGADFYMLPSTAFLRHDFTEFYRIAPRDEFGRGDVDKFGYFVVDVFRRGHVAHPIRTMGQTTDSAPGAFGHDQRLLANPKTSAFDRAGVELRHPWAEAMQISATGGVQEFGRKWARNDYPVLALWEMGARLSKVPDIDLAEAESRERMALMARMDHRFIVTSLGRPRSTLSAAELSRAGVAAFEVNATLEQFEARRAEYRVFRETSGQGIYFSKILAKDESRFDGQHFSHFVKAGYTIREAEAAADWLAAAVRDGTIDGITLRVEADEPLLPVARQLWRLLDATGAQALVSLKTSAPLASQERKADDENACRVVLAMILSRLSERVRYVFDIFMDMDRGYYPRHGFIDRRFEPRMPARAFAAISAMFSSASRFELVDPAPAHDAELTFAVDGQHWELWRLDRESLLMKLGSRAPLDIVLDLQSCASGTVDAFRRRVEGEVGPESIARHCVLICRSAGDR